MGEPRQSLYPFSSTLYWSVEVNWRTQVILLTRTTAPFPTGEILRNEFAQIDAALPAVVVKPRWGVCLDFRRAPYADNPEIERALVPARRAFTKDFHRYACIILGATGKMQSNRIRGHSPGDENLALFTDPAEAMSYAAGR